jgi:hypothetical protein
MRHRDRLKAEQHTFANTPYVVPPSGGSRWSEREREKLGRCWLSLVWQVVVWRVFDLMPRDRVTPNDGVEHRALATSRRHEVMKSSGHSPTSNPHRSPSNPTIAIMHAVR